MPSQKNFGTETCIKFESEEIAITGDYCGKSDSSKTPLPRFRNLCDKHHYHCSSFCFVWKGRYFILVSVYCVLLRFIKFMSRCCGDCAFSASFVRECTDVTGAPNVNFRKISVGKTI